jgi:hypothetical protein
MVSVVAIVLAFALSVVSSVAPLVLSSPQDAVTLDGSKHPELFPEWFIWEQILQSLPQSVSTSEPQHALQLPSIDVRLGISKDEMAILVNEARLFQQSKELLRKQLKEVRATLLAQGKSEHQIRSATKDVNLQYRYRILDSRGRLYQTLSPASLEGFRKEINHRLKGTTVHLRGYAATYFKLPW